MPGRGAIDVSGEDYKSTKEWWETCSSTTPLSIRNHISALICTKKSSLRQLDSNKMRSNGFYFQEVITGCTSSWLISGLFIIWSLQGEGSARMSILHGSDLAACSPRLIPPSENWQLLSFVSNLQRGTCSLRWLLYSKHSVFSSMLIYTLNVVSPSGTRPNIRAGGRRGAGDAWKNQGWWRGSEVTPLCCTGKFVFPPDLFRLF